MEIIGYVSAVLIGISLGLIGGGGSILTVPVLVYFFGIDAFLATEYSLFIVGISSAAGSVAYLKNGQADLKTALVFGVPSIVSIFLTRVYIVPLIPPELLKIGNFTLTRSIFLLLIFALLMIVASYKMIRKVGEERLKSRRENTFLAAGEGILVGALTGLVGAGGGFMIIPALVGLLKMPMKRAVGTSLVIISLNSLIGFLSSVGQTAIKWPFLISVAAIAVGGIIVGSHLSKKIDGRKLKPAFGWFILVMGISIILKEAFL
ncbi:MAG: sulfite exporter TauE/SafE family protein [Chryseobacterium sp.]|jgi:uncharacterized membrane protein YfcA|uniref:sulfite exporter TauE/SafE family protein n=1 Tax=Chryseobacterium sp. TaxID=1871047 RepID=UPI00283396DD|nr:sulfite exporter TauE/SafE family protein [Chryseobacterium sp.]MDR2238407.1 sulfite exporter TauE/SafE family protein [Chryseobacterium sp.]